LFVTWRSESHDGADRAAGDHGCPRTRCL